MGGDSESTSAMEETTLGQIIHNHRDRLIYLFDMFADRAFYIELTGAKEAEKGFEYPRVAFENAPAPDQYDPDAVSSDEGSIFEEMMGDFNDFEGDDNYDDEY